MFVILGYSVDMGLYPRCMTGVFDEQRRWLLRSDTVPVRGDENDTITDQQALCDDLVHLLTGWFCHLCFLSKSMRKNVFVFIFRREHDTAQ